MTSVIVPVAATLVGLVLVAGVVLVGLQRRRSSDGRAGSAIRRTGEPALPAARRASPASGLHQVGGEIDEPSVPAGAVPGPSTVVVNSPGSTGEKLRASATAVRRALSDQPISLDWGSGVSGSDGDGSVGFEVDPLDLSDTERVELVRLIGRFLTTMHDQNLVYGNLSWQSFTVERDDGVHVSVRNFGRTRALGTAPPLHQSPEPVHEWADPGRPESPLVGTIDGDRFRFALLAYRLLASRDRRSTIDASRPLSNAVMTPRQADHLAALWRRASGAPGTRPQVAEWLAALRDRNRAPSAP